MAAILVADDRPSDRAQLVSVLVAHAYVVIEAGDGAEALLAIRDRRPALVVFDPLTPNLGGYDLVRQVRSDANLADTRFLFYSASYLPKQFNEAAEMLGVAVLQKPAEPDVLLQKVAEIVRRPPHRSFGRSTGQMVEQLKQITETLVEAQEHTMLALRGSGVGVWGWDLVSQQFTLSPEFKALLGFEPDGLSDTFTSWFERVHPHDRERALNALRSCILGPEAIYESEQRLQHKDDTYRWILLRGICHRSESGRALQLAGAAMDITRLKTVEMEASQRQAMFSRRLIEAQDAERRHIARELHDDIGEILTAINLALDTGAARCADAARPAVLSARELVQELIDRVRDLSARLRPPVLDDLGLIPAVTAHLERYLRQTGIDVDFQHFGIDERRFGVEVEGAVYRIVQEALTNVARHAGANTAVVRLWATDDSLNVQIEDAGAGFVAAEADPQSSAGLSGMRERARLLGGDLAVESKPGEGTSINAHLPIGEPADDETP